MLCVVLFVSIPSMFQEAGGDRKVSMDKYKLSFLMIFFLILNIKYFYYRTFEKLRKV